MDAKTTIGRALRAIREGSGLSQGEIAERAGITYQYLSAVENGKENFTVGILESVATALGLNVESLVATAYHLGENLPRVNKTKFMPGVPLPPGLTPEHVEAALNETQKVMRLINATLMTVAGRPLPAFIQRNNFSGIVSNILCDSFSRLTPYKHNHDQRYPDLTCKGIKPYPDCGLEVKATIRVGKGGESHNGHSGWHVVACFSLDNKNGDILFVHVMFAELIGHGKPNSDWKYQKSVVNEVTGSQRTETYVTTPSGTWKLRHGSLYIDQDLIDIARWRLPLLEEAPDYSPFQIRRIVRKAVIPEGNKNESTTYPTA